MVKEIPYAPVVAESLSEVTLPLPIIPNFTEWADAVGTEIHKALVKQATVDEVLANAEKISNEMMDKIGYRK